MMSLTPLHSVGGGGRLENINSDVDKCHSMRVTRYPPDKHIQFDYTLYQQRLKQAQSAKYLGITISDDLDWGQHMSPDTTGAQSDLTPFTTTRCCL